MVMPAEAILNGRALWLPGEGWALEQTAWVCVPAPHLPSHGTGSRLLSLSGLPSHHLYDGDDNNTLLIEML